MCDLLICSRVDVYFFVQTGALESFKKEFVRQTIGYVILEPVTQSGREMMCQVAN